MKYEIHLKVVKKNTDKNSQSDEHALKEFRKANDVISPRVTRGGTLSLLARKIFNVLLYHTQRLGKPGANAPSDDPEYQEFYWIPLRELASDAAYNSEDNKVLKDSLEKLQDIKIVIDDAKGYASDVLIPKVRIIPDRRGRPTMVGWTLDSTTERILLRPEFYTRLSIYYLTSLRTTAGISLYENAKRYATNPSKLTVRESWEWWHDVLTGLPVTHEKPEYKYFKRDVLRPAINEVNTTDIRVELIEHKNGRRITHLQFKIERVVQGALELPPPPVIDTKTIDRIRELGIHPREAEDIFASNDDHLIRLTLDWVSERIVNKTLPKIESPAALFRSAIRGQYAIQKSLIATKRPSPIPRAVEIEDPAKVAAREAAREHFRGLDAADQDALLAIFEKENVNNPVILRNLRKSGISSKLVEAPLMIWLSARLAGTE